MRYGLAAMGFISLCFCAWDVAPVRADIYALKMPDGSVVFTDTPTEGDFKMVIRESPAANSSRLLTWREFAHKEARRINLDPKLVRAVIYVESGENPKAVSPKGAMGLMQLMPGTARDLGVENPMRPRENIRGGVQYLSQMLDRFGGDVRLALAAYNAGPGAVEKFGGVPPYPETQDFVKKVLNVYKKVSIDDDNT
jgi:soluble lytic murein transglycosylase